jgi:hypothetical protein
MRIDIADLVGVEDSFIRLSHKAGCLSVAAKLTPGFPCPIIANCDLHWRIIAERAFGAAEDAGDASASAS